MASPIVVGNPPDAGTGNCFPFGCAYDGEYQQVYSSRLFSGPITITDLEFYNTQYNSGATAMNSGTWTIFLSTTSADWNTMSGIFANNLGSNNTMVFTGNLLQPWAFGDTLHINLGTAFTYDPTQGNLLMDVMVSGASKAGGTIYFDFDGSTLSQRNTFFGRLTGSGGFAASGEGLVTGFSASVPEPGNLTLFGLGALLVGTFVGLRRRIA